MDLNSKIRIKERGRIMGKKKKILMILSTFILIGSSAYLYEKNNQNNEKISASTKENSLQKQVQKKNLLVSHDFKTTSDLSNMVEQSDVVVLGSYNSFDSSWNMARNPDDLNKEATDHHIEGRLYNFTVDEVLKGDLHTKDIRVNHRYSETIEYEETSGDEVVSPEGILIKEPSEVTTHNLENKDPSFIEPEYNKQYIVFLKKSFNPENNIYLRAIEPYLISIDANEVATLKSNLIEYNQDAFKTDVTLNNSTISISNDVNGEITDNISSKKLGDLKKDIKNLSK
jgi:hypothetical protein